MTRNLVGRMFEMSERSAANLKGFEESVECWDVFREAAITSRFEALRSGTTPLVGREDLEFASAIYLSDGVINLALLNYRGERGSGLKDAKSFVGAHHFGFQVDNIAETQQRIEAAGGQFFFDLGEDQEKENFERKFKDPDGIIFDISRNGWLGTSE